MPATRSRAALAVELQRMPSLMVCSPIRPRCRPPRANKQESKREGRNRVGETSYPPRDVGLLAAAGHQVGPGTFAPTRWARRPVRAWRLARLKNDNRDDDAESAYAWTCVQREPSVRILLLSMPDSFEHTPALAIRIPNGALASLAGNLDPKHPVAIADLILVQSAVQATVERLVREWRPDLIGL